MDLKQKLKILVNKLSTGNFDDVIFEATYLNKKHPEQEIFYNLLSLGYQAKGEYEKSIDLLEKALIKSKNNINFLNNLGLSYYKNKDYNPAEKYFQKILEIKPNYINALNNLAALYEEINHIEKSEDLLKKSIKINSEVIETNYNLASLLQSIGKFDEAKIYYKKTLELDENFTKADRGIAMLEKYNSSNNHIKIMEKKIQNEKLHKSNIINLSFALGKVYEDVKDYEKSFFYITKANQLKKSLLNYDIENDKKLFQKIKSFYKKNTLKKTNLIQSEKKIIFILGMPRTGTSLVEQIISSHSEVYGGGEILLLSNYFQKFFNQTENKKDIENIFNNFKNNYLNFLNKMSNTNIITDKAPLNFRWIGFIKSIFPNSIIIHCSRDPFENSWSIYKNEFEGGMFFSNDIIDIANYYKIYQDLMDFWKKNLKNQIFDLKYEDLINNPEQKIKELIKFCNLNWQQNCLEFYKNKKIIKTVSFNQARKPIYKDSIKGTLNFKKYLKNLDSELKN